MQRDVWIKLTLSEEEAAMFEGRTAMVVALSDEELIRLRNWINGVDSFLRFLLKGLRTMRQAIEGKKEADGQIARTLDQLREPAKTSAELHDAARQLLGRAVFVSHNAERKLQ